jgi:DNA-binding LacI/PurR family transcriptional regulator
VFQDFAELGRRALNVALAAVRGDRDTVLDPILPTLTLRQSTAEPGGHPQRG